MLPFILIAGVGGLVALVAVRMYRADRERTAGIVATATRMGWTYRSEVSFDTIPKLDRFELFTQGHHRRIANLMTSPAGDPAIVVFDYTYTTGGGKSQSTHRQTVLYAVSDVMQLPTFSVRPQHFLHGVAKVFGYQDIDIERRPLFSDMFLLRGEDESAVRDAFGDAVAEVFESREDVCAAGAGRELLYWRPGRRVGADQLESFIAEGVELARRFGGSTA